MKAYFVTSIFILCCIPGCSQQPVVVCTSSCTLPNPEVPVGIDEPGNFASTVTKWAYFYSQDSTSEYKLFCTLLYRSATQSSMFKNVYNDSFTVFLISNTALEKIIEKDGYVFDKLNIDYINNLIGKQVVSANIKTNDLKEGGIFSALNGHVIRVTSSNPLALNSVPILLPTIDYNFSGSLYESLTDL